MICQQCEKVISDGLETCPFCGAEPVAETVAPSEPDVPAETAEPVETVEAEPADLPEADETLPAGDTDGEDTIGKVLVPEKKIKENRGKMIGFLIGGIALFLLIALGVIIFVFKGFGLLTFGSASGSQTAADISNLTARESLFFQLGDKIYLNHTLDTEAEVGIYEISPDGSEKKMVIPGYYNETVPLGKYILATGSLEDPATTKTGKNGAPLVLIDPNAEGYGEYNKAGEMFEPELIAESAISLRISGDWCYFSAYNGDQNQRTGIYRYNPSIGGEPEKVCEDTFENYGVYGDTIVYLTYDTEEKISDIFTLKASEKGEAVKIGTYPMQLPLLQFTESHIYFVNGKDEGKTLSVARIKYDGSEYEDLINIPTENSLYGLHYLLVGDHLYTSVMRHFEKENEQEPPEFTSVLQQHDLDGNFIAELFDSPSYNLAIFDGNYYYITQSTVNFVISTAYRMRNAMDKENMLFLVPADPSEAPSWVVSHDEPTAAGASSDEPADTELSPETGEE